MTTIELDTCNCIIEYTDDQSTLITKIIQECTEHTHTVDESFVGGSSQLYNIEINKKIEMSETPTQEEIQESINIKDQFYLK